MIINFYILFLVSLPLAVLDLAQFLLFTGNKNRLMLNKANIVRFAAAVFLMLIATYLIRSISPNVPINMLLHIIAYVIILLLVYRMNFQYAVLGVAFTMLIYSTIDNVTFPYIIKYFSKGLENFENQFVLYPLFTLPNFICSIIVIRLLWKYEIHMLSKINSSFHKLYIKTALILIVIEYFLSFIFNNNSSEMSLGHQITFSAALLLLTVCMNLIIFNLYHKTIIGLVQKGYANYLDLEESARFAFTEIQKMLYEKNYEEAINFIDELMEKEENKNNERQEVKS